MVTQVEARLTAKGVGDHLRLAKGKMAGHGEARCGLTAGPADAAEGVDEQGMVADRPGARHSIGLKGGAAEAAAPVGRGVPVVPGDLAEALGSAPQLPIGAQLHQGLGQQRLHREQAIRRRCPVDGPSLGADRVVEQTGGLEEPPAIPVGGLAGDAHRFLRPPIAMAAGVVVPHHEQVAAGPLPPRQGLHQPHPGHPTPADLHRRGRDPQHRPLPKGRLRGAEVGGGSQLHTLQPHAEVILGAGTSQGLERPDPGAAIEPPGHHVALGRQGAGLGPEVDVRGEQPHQGPQPGLIRPGQGKPAPHQVGSGGRGLLHLQPDPVLTAGGGLGRLRQDQPADPVGMGPVEGRIGAAIQRIEVGPVEGSPLDQGIGRNGGPIRVGWRRGAR